MFFSANLRTAHVYARINVHSSHAQHSTKLFWKSSILTSRQFLLLTCCLLEGKGRQSFTFKSQSLSKQ